MSKLGRLDLPEPIERRFTSVIGAVLCLAFLLSSQFGYACRCAERPLAGYFDAATEVFVGTLEKTVELEGQRREFVFRKHGEPYKALADVESLPTVSHVSSAACAVRAELGADYVVFAERDEASGVSWITSCNGTRLIRTGNGEAFGFEDVPARFLVSQLTALSGLEALRRTSFTEGDANQLDNVSIQGLLDVSALSHSNSVPLFTAPSDESDVAAQIESYEQTDHRESGYEVDAALVYAHSGEVDERWYKVKLASGSFAWVSPDAAGTYWPLDVLLPNRLNYLTDEWNRLVWPSLGAGLPIRLSYTGETRPDEQPARVLATQRIGGSLWLEVEVLKTGPCDAGDSRTLARGWIPAYSQSGKPVAWYYSRGC